MTSQLRLMCVLAHPDDESLGLGGILARYAAEGIECYLLTATRGEVGWPSATEAYPGPQELGQMREAELRQAADLLGIHEVALLDYQDGELEQADPQRIIGEIAHHLCRVRPQVVVTFDPYGAYGHPDHIAICQFTMAAIVRAASVRDADAREPDVQPTHGSDAPPHQVSKLYFRVDAQAEMVMYVEIFGEPVMEIEGIARRAVGWPEWAITTRVDTRDYWRQVWKAVFCHKTQLPGLAALQALPVARQQMLWQRETFYRAFSLVNGGSEAETDLFAGLRASASVSVTRSG